jgi:predicted permease
VVCANVASLLLARGRARARELSVRVALGAARARIVRQLFTEAALVAVAGGGLGVAVAAWLGGWLAPALSIGEPIDVLTRVDGRVLAFATIAACASAVLFGMVPAFRATDLNVGAGLQEAGRGAAIGARRRFSGVLVVAQFALSLLLVSGAALLVRSVWNLERVDLGFNPSSLLLFRIDPSLNGYEGARATDLYTSILDRLRAAPGVTAASLSSYRLVSNSSAIGVVTRSDETVPAPGSPEAGAFERSHLGWTQIVEERFFATMGLPILRGRTFEPADERGGPVAIVNRSLARRLYQTDDAVGRTLYSGSRRRPGTAPIRVVGVVEDAIYTSVRSGKPPTLYLYYRQLPIMKNAPTFEVRTAGSPAALTVTVRDLVRAIDPHLPVYGITTQENQIAASLRQERLFARLATVLGSVAVFLSAIGLYGLLAYGVARRVPEIGLRMALGAARERVLWMVLRESLALAGAGLLIGVPLALAGTRVLQSMLFGLAPRDPATLGAAAAAMLVLGLAAAYVPARRAARVDPLVALRDN